jgi:hypothetical protein
VGDYEKGLTKIIRKSYRGVRFPGSPGEEIPLTLTAALEYPPVRSPRDGFMTPEKADEYTAFTSAPLINAHISNNASDLTERFVSLAGGLSRTYNTDFIRRLHI